MSDDSADSTVSDEEDEAERRVTRGGSFGSGMARRLRALFCCVLKRKPRAHEVVECDPDEYDYVVEKLIVRRVPVALIAIPTDLADGASRSMSSSTLGAKRASMKIKTNKTLRFEDELQDSTGGRQVYLRQRINLQFLLFNF
ncbi:uncharacterized protein LOC118644841 [Monomorium pharaonis]|uniref:uncharacterized protein LOC118644841 n=1 Tax=Monomorium pharaonis TaxID=307658 RepID=UPI0017461EF1|nr:uncharacterized protein LOC118644841 [Monomorium pharaonis]